MNVTLITHTPEPEKVVASAAKLCYSSSDIKSLMDKQTPEAIEKFLSIITENGHGSVLEHATFTFGVEGVSRSLLAQLTRHRIASFSVQSQRYVDMSNFTPVIPKDVKNNPMAMHEFEMCISQSETVYKKITKLLEDSYISEGVDEKLAHKKAIENARAVLPNACPTKIVFTMNARSLLNFFELRCCRRSQDEIKELADKMLILCRNIAPNLFRKAGASCTFGICKEGKMSCGKPRNEDDYE